MGRFRGLAVLLAAAFGAAHAEPARTSVAGPHAPHPLSAGCVTDAGSVTFTASATLEVDIGGPTPCTQHDRLSVAGTLTLQGAALRVNLLSGYQPPAGVRFDVLDWGSLSGTFGSLLLPALPPGFAWDSTRLYIDGSLGVTGPPLVEADVPLPPWALALLAALLCAGLYSRQARRKP